MAARLGPISRLLAIGRRSDAQFDRRILFLSALSLAAAIVEVGALASMVPLLFVLSGREAGLPFWFDVRAIDPLWVVLTFAVLVSCAAIIRLTLLASIQWRVVQIGHWINVAIQRRLLAQPFLFHASQNSSRFVAALQRTDQLALGVMGPLIQGLASLAIGFGILLFLLVAIDWQITLSAAALLGGAYWLLSRFAARRLRARGATSDETYEQQVRLLMESSGAIRDIIIDHRQAAFGKIFERVSWKLAEARTGTDFLSMAPRFFVEAVGAIALAGLAVLISVRDGTIINSLPVFGLLAMAMVRIVPLAQTAYRGWALLAAHQRTIDEVDELLSLPLQVVRARDLPRITMDRVLEFRGVRFRYPETSRNVLAGANLQIRRGEWLGLTGSTGGGKSTIGDLAMGLLRPDTGEILIDGSALDSGRIQRWQRSVAHVSQSVYLLDDSIAANIVLDPADSDIDWARLAECTKIAQLDGWIAELSDGLETAVGERGRKLSGGQRQRIGIARALYKRADFLVLDEATNSLDAGTEAALLDALRQSRPDITALMISHRETALARCDRVLKVEGGRLAPA